MPPVGVMNTDNKNENGSEAKAKEETATLKLGLDVHAAQITMCRQWEGLGPQPAQKLSWEKALKWIREQLGEVATRLPADQEVARRWSGALAQADGGGGSQTAGHRPMAD